jgi:flagellin
MLSVNFNSAGFNAATSLNKSSEKMSVSMQRLTSGFRINSSRDDAAGFQIANRLDSQLRGMSVSIRNANDSISLAQTAEGGLQESTNILQRMRELSMQSSNDTNTATDREALQSELSELVSEFDRIGNQTSFNGRQLLTGSFQEASFQIGANAGQTLSLSIDGARASDVGKIAKATGTEVTANAATDITLKVGNSSVVSVGSSSNYAHATDTTRGADSAYAKAAAINAADSPVVATAETSRTSADLTAKLSQAATGASSYVLDINGTEVINKSMIATETLTVSEVVSAINNNSNTTGVTASLDTSSNEVTLTAADGRNMTLTETAGGAGITALLGGSGDFAASGTVNRGSVTLAANDTIAVGGTAADIGAAGSINRDSKGIDSIDISSQSGAADALLRIDSAIESIDKSRASLGAMQNRFDSVINNLRNSSENTAAAKSRIMDTDYAKEAANMMKQQILQQSSTAMLAQANQNSQMILSLLK